MDVTKSVSTDKGNPVKLEFADISNEAFRTYDFGDGRTVTIHYPVKLNVKRKLEGDSHRLIDQAGNSHYIPAGWCHLLWQGKDGTTYDF